MKKVILILILALNFVNLWSQEIYSTNNATLRVEAILSEKVIVGQTNKLTVILDYETTEIIILFNTNTLRFDNDSLNEIFRKVDLKIRYDGKLGLDYIITKSHPPLSFDINGKLNIDNEDTEVNGSGQLFHVSDSGNYVCMLSMKYRIDVEDLELKFPDNMHHVIEFNISKALLEKDKN